MSIEFNSNELEYNDDSDEENNSYENNYPNNSKFQHQKNLGESMSTVYSLNKIEDKEINFQSIQGLHQSHKFPFFFFLGGQIFHEEEEEDEDKNEFNNIEYQNLLNSIIYQGQINNSVIISENEKFINYISIQTIKYNINKNKKICILVSELKKSQMIYEKYIKIPQVKVISLEKNKGKKSKNDYQTFRKQIDDNNIIIVLQNALYKLLSIGFVTIFDFGLIIFDDCHLCDSNHPYNIIMQEFYFYYLIKNPNIMINQISQKKRIKLMELILFL